jgi:hypothetical protein
MPTYIVDISGTFSYRFNFEIDDADLPVDATKRDEYIEEQAAKEYQLKYQDTANLGDCIDELDFEVDNVDEE